MSDPASITFVTPPDTLNEIGVLKRREIEARMVGAFVDALALEFDRERVIAILSDTVIVLPGARAPNVQHTSETTHYWLLLFRRGVPDEYEPHATTV